MLLMTWKRSSKQFGNNKIKAHPDKSYLQLSMKETIIAKKKQNKLMQKNYSKWGK